MSSYIFIFIKLFYYNILCLYIRKKEVGLVKDKGKYWMICFFLNEENNSFLVNGVFFILLRLELDYKVIDNL